MNWEETFKSVEAWLTTEGIKVLIALILFFVAFKLIDFFCKKIEKKAEKKIEKKQKYRQDGLSSFVVYYKNRT